MKNKLILKETYMKVPLQTTPLVFQLLTLLLIVSYNLGKNK